MAYYDAAYLLQLFNRDAGRPATDTITDQSKYDRLTESQDALIEMVSAISPQSLYPKVAYGSMPTCSTTDNQVFTFGLDTNGNAITPLGKAGIYPNLASIPDCAWVEGRDYLDEGNQIRIPNNGMYAGTLYWRGITPPPPISASSQPVLLPVSDRKLIVLHAVRQFATEYDRNPGLAAAMGAEFDLRFPRWCLALKTQFKQGGALGSWTGLQLATIGQSSFAVV